MKFYTTYLLMLVFGMGYFDSVLSCDLAPYTAHGKTYTNTLEGIPISITEKTTFRFDSTQNNEYLISSHTDSTIHDFTGFYTQLAQNKIPGSGCHHRYHPHSYRTWVENKSVIGSFAVRYQKWTCLTIKEPYLHKGWIPRTRDKIIKTRLYQKTVTITNTITPYIQNNTIKLHTHSRTHADGGLSDGLGIFGEFFIPFDMIINYITMNSVRIPTQIIDIPAEIPTHPEFAGFSLELSDTGFISSGETTLRISYKGNKKLRRGSTCRLKELIIKNYR